MSEDHSAHLNKILNSLKNVDPKIDQMVLNISKKMSEMEIIRNFNQFTIDLFNLIYEITNAAGVEKYVKIKSYKVLLESALKVNVKLPIESFTWFILEFAPKIYSEDEDYFLEKQYDHDKVEVGNEFSFINSNSFKEMWKTLDDENKKKIKNAFLMTTTYAHAYFYKTIMVNGRWS
jgi:hypothetical protein